MAIFVRSLSQPAPPAFLIAGLQAMAVLSLCYAIPLWQLRPCAGRVAGWRSWRAGT